jgi:hypothetical protein
VPINEFAGLVPVFQKKNVFLINGLWKMPAKGAGKDAYKLCNMPI